MARISGSIGRRPLLGAAAASAPAGPAVSQGAAANTLRFVPHANLSSLDPLWSSALISTNYALMVHDFLYGLGADLLPRPQMVEEHELSANGLTWTFRLREGLWFHDGEPVRAADCLASIRRWSQRDVFGKRVASQTADMRVLDDRRFEIRLTKPFPLMPFALTQAVILPERVARTDAFTQVTESIGSGPFRFVRDEWVAGSRAVFRKFERYVPRHEPPEAWAGGKVVHLERVEWQVMPDAATAVAALQQGEVDWMERPLLDLVPRLRRMRDVTVEVVERLGFYGFITFNTRVPPFDNPALRRALVPAVDQQEFMQALAGGDTELTKTGFGWFHPESPYANDEGLATLIGQRNLELARKLVRESGYDGRPVVQMLPTDLPAPNAIGLVANALLRGIGLNVDLQAMDWGTMVGRWRASGEGADRNPWHCFALSWSGLWTTNPGMHTPLYGNDHPNPRMEALRGAWFDAPDLDAQKQVARRMQALALEEPPFIPVGLWIIPHAWRASRVSGILRAPSTVFWNVRKTA
ncbi:ABC transporter substrate-binding protein [Belnapia moabensis]|uniref:ABC transporter substrate-binding protein n=1 Tax=Belnapia moabensis TaxID=365533 RepID=UPI000A6520E7|nr:ABC transporter substrate-binding protein [Belnapia moabensis]